MGDVTRRAAIATAGAALSAAALVGSAQAQTAPATSPARPGPGPGRFACKVVLVTGGNSGIGRATAEAFAAEGARVVIAARREAENAAAVEAIARAGGSAEAVATDVREEDQVRRLVEEVVRRHGRLDVACNNAGIFPATAPVAEEPEEVWRDVMRTNLYGVRYGLRHQIPVMARQGGGAIVNTASTLGLFAIPGVTSYAAAKHGVVALTRAAALDYADKGVRVNAVAPGPVWMPMMRGWVEAHGGEAALRPVIDGGVPRKRMGRPEEVAQAILWLASDQASYVSGQIHEVDGGKTAREG